MGFGLFERFALWRHEDDAGVGGAEFFDGGEEWFRFEEHALASAAKVVVGLAMFVGGPVAELVGVDFDDAGFLGALDDAFAEWGESDLGEEGEDFDFHRGYQLLVIRYLGRSWGEAAMLGLGLLS